MNVALGKVVVDIVTLNWTMAMKSALDALSQITRRRSSVVRRATRRAVTQLKQWRLAEGVSEDDFLEALQIADRAISALTAETYVDCAVEHGRDPAAVAAAIVKAEARRNDSAQSIAVHVLETTLTALLALPAFAEKLDQAIAWSAASAMAAQASQKQKSIRNAGDVARARSAQFEQALHRHSSTRVFALSMAHADRDLHGNVGSELSNHVTRAETWRTELEHEKTVLRRALIEANRRTRSAGPIGGIDLGGSYDAAHIKLQDAAEFLRPSPDHERVSNSAKKALARLRREANEPRYRTAILLTGRWGAGKSRILAAIGVSILSDQVMQLILRPLPGAAGQLDTAILAEAQVATGRPYASLVELRSDLKEHNARAVIFVDDLERFLPTREELDRITQLMLDLTDDDRLRWVLTVDSWRLDRVLSPDSTPRWDRMSAFPQHTRTVSKWIDLDSSDLGQLVGGALISRELGQRPITTQSVTALLDVPLNAWLYIDAARAADQATAIGDFDNTYWNEVINSFTSTRAERHACRAVRHVLEQLFTASSGRHVPLDHVYANAGTLSTDAVDDAIDVLGEARLISVSPTDFVSMESSALWAGGIARHALPSDLPMTKNELRGLLSFVINFQAELAEALVANILFQASKKPDQLAPIVRIFLQENSISGAGIWAAAINDLDVRREVLTELRRQNPSPEPASAHQIYLLLRLFEVADLSFPTIDALRRLKPSYATIGDNGLQIVLHQVLSRLSDADVESVSARADLLIAADGIERAHAGKQFADRWVAAAGELMSPDRLLNEADSFLRGMVRYTGEQIAASAASGAGRPDEAPFALHLIDAAIPDVVRRLGPEYAYDLLAGRGWLDEDDWRDGLGGELRRACHVALGKSYVDDPLSVVSLLNRLLRGDRMEQESAVFILRHTGPTFGRVIRLREELMPFAIRLNDSKRLDRDVKLRWVRPMLNPPDA